MTDKDLRKLRRDDLLQILINQQKQIDTLTEALKRSEEAQADRELTIKESGTLAEAMMKMMGVFDAAQKAADEYEAQMRSRADNLLAEAEKRAEEANRQADSVVKNAHSEAERIVSTARREAESLSRPAAPAPAQPAESPSEAEASNGKRHRWLSRGNR